LKKIALNNINLISNEENLLGLIGHTGSGKSTLVQHLNGLNKTNIRQDIIVDGIDITKKMQFKRIRQK
jgi:energy-coupling factor transport system ATP-binding protein